MKFKRISDNVALLRKSRTEPLIELAILLGFVALSVWISDENGLARILKAGGFMMLWTLLLLALFVYRFSARPIKRLREPPVRFDKSSGLISRGSEQIASVDEVAAVQVRNSARVSLVRSDDSKAFVLQEFSGAEATAEALAEFLNVDLRRKGDDPWKEPL